MATNGELQLKCNELSSQLHGNMALVNMHLEQFF